MTRIAFLHTGAVVIPAFASLAAELLPDVEVQNLLDDKIVGDLSHGAPSYHRSMSRCSLPIQMAERAKSMKWASSSMARRLASFASGLLPLRVRSNHASACPV